MHDALPAFKAKNLVVSAPGNTFHFVCPPNLAGGGLIQNKNERRGRMVSDVGLSTRGSWVRFPAKAQRGVSVSNPQLGGVAIISRIACGIAPLAAVKK
jgi:hypothetical protein